VTDARALPRLLDELVWTLRREGLAVAPSQVLDLTRAVAAIGWDDVHAVREAAAAIVVQRAADLPRFGEAFARFFARDAPSRDLWQRLSAQGFTEGEVTVLRELLLGIAQGSGEELVGPGGLRALLEGGSETDHLLLLASIRREIDELRSPMQVGFFTQRISRSLGLARARERLATVRQSLRGALGARGDALADALARELDRASDSARDHVLRSLRRATEKSEPRGKDRAREDLPFTSLNDRELEEVARAVRSFADRLRGRERVRTRRARRGRVDPGRTLRGLTRTGGVPFRPVRRQKRRDRPCLLLLCDVSDSVRAASRFMLELVYAAHDLMGRTRSFVFVSELGETTLLFERERAGVALAAAYGGDVVPVTDNSNYGRVLRAFEQRYLSSVDRRTTVVILGDGRTNYHEASEQVLARIRERARALYWFSTEPRSGWSSGDSAMRLYAPHCTAVLEVTTARELEDAARTLVLKR
jgi:uncharacterized protein with von Willebrand factor type A (vWA) domain